MKTVSDPGVLRDLSERLGRLRADTPRRWGVMTAHEMLCHLGDATDLVLRVRSRPAPPVVRPRRLAKFVVLKTALPLPRGFPTSPLLDPKADGTRPSDFERDRARVLAGLLGIAAASPETLEPVHGYLGPMSAADWCRWAYRHTDYHLRQFGL